MGQALLEFTPEAIEHLLVMIEKKTGAVGFRLSIKETGCTGLMYVPALIDEVNPSDEVLSVCPGLTVYVDKAAAPAIRGTRIDYLSVGLGQKQLAYQNPNADSLCGCGESFNLRKSRS